MALITFHRYEVIAMANRNQVLKYRIALYDSLTHVLETNLKLAQKEVELQKSVISDLRTQIRVQSQNEFFLRNNIDLLTKQLEDQKPTWIQSPVLWSTVGVVAGYLLFHK